MSAEINPSLSGMIPGITPTTGIGEEEITTTTGPDGTSTISSAKEQEEHQIIRWGIPFLPFPVLENIQEPKLQLEAIQLMLSQTKSEVVNFILDKWADSVAQIKEDTRRDIQKKIKMGLDRGFNPVSGENSGQAAAQAAAMGMILAIMAIGLGASAIVTAPGTAGVNELGTVAIAMQLVPPSMHAELGLMGALYAAAIFYPSMVATLAAAGGDTAKVIDLDFAKQYASQVLAQVLNPNFESFVIATALAKSENPEALTSNQLTRLVLIAKLSMLFSALALYYKTETGGITAEEMAGMLSGEIVLEEGDRRNHLIAMIKTLMEELPEESRASLLSGFNSYFDESPELEDLLDFTNLLRTYGENKDYERLTENNL